MSKKWFLFIVLALSVVFITACEDVPGGSSTLTAIVYTGVSDAEIENGVTFNFLTGVKAMGNDGVDYTDKITITSTSSAVNVTTKALDTTAVGVHAVRYEVVVGEIVARQFRYITVKSPQVVAGEFLVNKDISQGALGWNDPSVVYVADGAAMTLTAENGELKAVVVAGSNSFTPRFGQMNIPFEQGKTYQVSFDARSSVAKEVSLQVGEVLAGPPYFTDFLPAAEPFVFRTITTTMQRYSYKFTMNLDNQKGGILFGLGTVKGQKVDATMYFDNFEIVESTPDADTTGPAISGTKDVSILVGGNFSPLVGVTALDVTDGDVTANITVVIKNSAGVVVSAVDTSEAGTYTVTYTVFDSLNNKTEITTTVTIQERSPLLFIDADQIIDGSFTTTPAVVPGETQNAAFQDITDAGFWYMYDGSWSGAAATYGVTEGKFEIDVTKVAGEVWHFMLKQKGITLLEGETYVLSFDAFASVNRPISVGFNPDIALEVVNLTTTSQTFEIEFTYEGATLETRIEFLFGGAVGKVTLDNVKLEIGVDEDALIDINTNEFVDGTFTTTPAVVPVETQNAAFQDITDAGFWYMYDGSWSGAAATYGVTDGKFEIDVTKVAGEVWHFMLKQKGIELVKNTLYTLSFTAFASVDRPISVGFNPDIALEVVNLTTIAKTYEISFFYTGDTLETRIEFLFGGAVGKVTLDDVILYESVYPALLTLTDSGEFVDGAFATTPAVVPGETQNAAFQDITDAGFWYIYDGSWSGAAATYGVTDGKFEIDVTKVAGEVWHFILKQKGIELVKNTLYTLSFTAFASVDRPISVGFNPDIALEVVNLTTTAKTYEISFYYTGDTLETRIEFLFGGAVGKVTLDDVVLLQVASEEVVVPVLDKLVAPVNGVNHTIATNHVGIGPYDGGVGYNGQLRFVWFEKGTENIKGSDVFAAPAGVGYAYIYTTFLESLPDGVYTVKFQAVGDQVLGLDSDFSIHTFEVSKLAEVIEEGTTITLDFGTVQKTGYALGTFTFINTGSTIEYTFSKDRAQIATSANEPHTSKGAFVVFAPISTAKESYVEMDLTSFTDLSKISFNISTWSATALTNINALANKGTFGLQFYNPTTQAWEFVKTINNAENIISKLSSTEYVNVEFTVTQSGRYRLYYNSPDATSTTNTAYAITVDDFKLTYVEVPVAVKLPTPVNGFNHTVATNHVGIGPYAGGTGYTGQLRFVWLEKGTENVKGTDLFNAPAGAGLAYIYTTFLATLPDGVYTVKFQAVGDQVLGLDSDFFPTTFEVTKAAPVPQFIGYNVLTSVGTRVTYSGTTANWWEKNVQLILDSFDGTKTTATFDFKGVAGQEYVLKIEGAAPSINRELTITATGLLQTVVLDISGLDLAQRNGLRLAIVFAKTLNGAGTFDVYNVKEATTTKSWVGFGMTLAKFDVFAFPAQAPETFFNNNVQLTLLSFDNANTLATFNFTGKANVEYLFKIEVSSSVFVEKAVVATGALEAVELDLSNLTPEQRSALKLIIIFDKNSTTGSVLTLDSIVYSLPPVDTTGPVITGAIDKSILIDSTFNPLTGVTAVDDTDGDVTSTISVVIKNSLDVVVPAVNTSVAGVFTVTYTVTDSLANTTTRTITITVAASVPAEPTNIVLNADIAQGVTSWDNSLVKFGNITLTEEAGELKVVVVPGGASHEGRFGQMNIPFVNGVRYEVSFDARSSATKEIFIQVGQIFAGPPYFTSFTTGVYRTITTTTQRYSFVFTMNVVNQNGGLVFELGGVNGQRVNATMFFDNFEVSEYVDTDGPEILGAKDVSINVGSTFNPLAGVTAVDVTDGAVTANLSVVIKNSLDAVVTTLDTASEGVFTVTYSVTDSLGNSSNKTITVTVVTAVPVTQTQLKAFTAPDLAGAGGGMVNTYGGGIFRNIVWHDFVSGTTGAAKQDGNANGVRITVFASDGTTKLGEVLVTTSGTSFDIRTTNGFNNFLVAGNIIHIQAAPSSQGITNNYTFSAPLIYTLAA